MRYFFSPAGDGNALPHRYALDGQSTGEITHLIPRDRPASVAQDEISPVAHLVTQDAGTPLRAHFHGADQFQVFIAGSGRFGAETIAPLSVHYASAFSGYGPIVAGDDGLSYLTLRNGADMAGPRFLPESRPQQRPGHREQFFIRIDGETLHPDRPGEGWHPHHPSHTQVGVWSSVLGCGQSIKAPTQDATRGQYWLALAESAPRAWHLSSGLFQVPSGDAGEFVASRNTLLLLLQFSAPTYPTGVLNPAG